MAHRRRIDPVVPAALAIATAVGALATGCGDSGDPAMMMMMTADGPIPQGDSAALLDWLTGRGYAEWPAESAIHGGAGPHFGDVRSFLSDDLVASLDQGGDQHPAGSATVKELYASGDSVQGWSVSIKLDADSAGGDNWYWYEYYEGSVLADADALSVCTGCHGGGTDYVLTPFPLQ